MARKLQSRGNLFAEQMQPAPMQRRSFSLDQLWRHRAPVPSEYLGCRTLRHADMRQIMMLYQVPGAHALRHGEAGARQLGRTPLARARCPMPRSWLGHPAFLPHWDHLQNSYLGTDVVASCSLPMSRMSHHWKIRQVRLLYETWAAGL